MNDVIVTIGRNTDGTLTIMATAPSDNMVNGLAHVGAITQGESWTKVTKKIAYALARDFMPISTRYTLEMAAKTCSLDALDRRAEVFNSLCRVYEAEIARQIEAQV